MLDEVLFPVEWDVGIQRIEQRENALTIWIGSTAKRAVCPGCGTESERIHSVYERHPQDLPLVGHVVRLCASVRRFFCDNATCGRRTFAEQFPALLAVRARRTRRLMAHQQAIAWALGGEAGHQLCGDRGMPISADSLVRAIRGAPERVVSTPRVLGLDDWAKRKGQDYGTILVDLETRQPVDLLDSRTADAVAAWLKAHPGVEVVSRDRSGDYSKAVSDGAPEAEQVADRWHLLSNLRDALVVLLEQKPAALKAAAEVATVTLDAPGCPAENGGPVRTAEAAQNDEALSIDPPATDEPGPTQAQPIKATRQARRQARFEQVHAVYEATGSMRATARQLHMSRRAVRR